LADNSSQPFQFAWTCSSTFRTLVSNGIPNHTVGTFPIQIPSLLMQSIFLRQYRHCLTWLSRFPSWATL
jgi:hypothetical protein